MHDEQGDVRNPIPYNTVIVGGGITGLYCAMKLADKFGPTHRIGVFESSPRWGGRIETKDIDGFTCEFGPMRYELDIQPLLDDLLEGTFGLKRGTDIIKFPAFATAEPKWPQYSLLDDERRNGKDFNALELTKLALIRIFKGSTWASPGDATNPNDPRHGEWLLGLYKSDAYDAIRRGATFNGTPLWAVGFWNVLSDVLSHQAVLKIRDTGNFYHLIPDNPNAVEWIVFWLRGLIPPPDGQLWTLRKGSGTITDLMIAMLGRPRYEVSVKRHPRHTLTDISMTSGERNRVDLRFHAPAGGIQHARADNVILAIPRSPLMKFAHRFTPQTREDLNAAFGFPLLKIFFTADKPWWSPTEPVHTQADKLPTRELHYQRRENLGMIMLYTDRPGSEYWKIYVKDSVHDQAEINGDERLKGRFAKYLAQKLTDEARQFTLQQLTHAAQAFATGENSEPLPGIEAGFDPTIYLRALEADSVDAFADELEATIRKFGIRDWSREPYGGACHSWRPGTQAIDVLGRLKAFRLDQLSGPNIRQNVHVCGEAFCDYNGFIEGSLRSAVKVIEKIEKVVVVVEAVA